jgi:hypothetical protein
MATPRSLALLNLTMSVDRMTEVRGAMADTQKSFRHFFACKYESRIKASKQAIQHAEDE